MYRVRLIYISVAYVCVFGAKSTGPIAKKVCFFCNLIFFGSENFQDSAHVLLK
jgi:hypothetical protein